MASCSCCAAPVHFFSRNVRHNNKLRGDGESSSDGGWYNGGEEGILGISKCLKN